MNLLKHWVAKPIPLHALEPGETLHERCYWLALFVKQLKGEKQELLRRNEDLQEQNITLLARVSNGAALTVEEEELVTLRAQVQELKKKNLKLTKRLANLGIKATHLQTELAQATQAA